MREPPVTPAALFISAVTRQLACIRGWQVVCGEVVGVFQRLVEHLLGWSKPPEISPAPVFAHEVARSPLRVRIPETRYDLAELQEALACLDRTAPAEVAARSRFWGGAYFSPKGRSDAARDAMKVEPESAWIFCDDPSGYIREAALNRLSDAPTSPGRLVMLVLRLNDWVPEVRFAALGTAQRLLPGTNADIIAACADLILRRRFEWSRWSDEAVPLDIVFSRRDVSDALANRLLESTEGGLGRMLRDALRFPSMDPHLPDLAFRAKSASVRAMALRTLVNGRADWPIGYSRTWIDKVYNRSRRVIVFDSRLLPRSDVGALIRQALDDRSTTVRKVVADALWKHAAAMVDGAAIAERLSQDRSASVRERAGAALKKLAQESACGPNPAALLLSGGSCMLPRERPTEAQPGRDQT